MGGGPAEEHRQGGRAACPERPGLRHALAVPGRDRLGREGHRRASQPSERLPWHLANARDMRQSDLGDSLWVRLFDILARSKQGRTQGRAAWSSRSSTARPPGAGRGCSSMTTVDGATCRATDRSADLTIDVSALSSAYLGGTRLSDAVIATGYDEHRDGSLAQAERLLRRLRSPGPRPSSSRPAAVFGTVIAPGRPGCRPRDLGRIAPGRSGSSSAAHPTRSSCCRARP